MQRQICCLSCSFLRHLLLTTVKGRPLVWRNMVSFSCATVRGTAEVSVGDLCLVWNWNLQKCISKVSGQVITGITLQVQKNFVLCQVIHVLFSYNLWNLSLGILVRWETGILVSFQIFLYQLIKRNYSLCCLRGKVKFQKYFLLPWTLEIHLNVLTLAVHILNRSIKVKIAFELPNLTDYLTC